MEETNDSTPTPPSSANPMAVISLLMGIASFILLVFLMPFFFLTGLVAVVFGHLAVRKIRLTFGPMKGRGMARAGLTLGYVGIVAAFVVPMFGRECEKGTITKGISNCRQIITTLRLYSSDNGGNYPDADPSIPTNSNDVFRLMFVGGEAENEMIFGCPNSPYVPDGNIGKSPGYLEALKPGENHWAMTKGLNDSASGDIPLVYENPTEASWPLKWNADFAGQPKPGRCWRDGTVIVGMNDSSVTMPKLESKKGDRVGLQLLPGNKPVFPQGEDPHDLHLSVLNVAR